MSAPLRALLQGAIDYAGLFPPAALSMADAAAFLSTASVVMMGECECVCMSMSMWVEREREGGVVGEGISGRGRRARGRRRERIWRLLKAMPCAI